MRHPIKGRRISICAVNFGYIVCVKTGNCATLSPNIKGKRFREKQVHSHRRMLQPLPTRRLHSNSMLSHLQVSVDAGGGVTCWACFGLLCIRGSALPLRMDMLPAPPQFIAEASGVSASLLKECETLRYSHQSGLCRTYQPTG